MDARALVTATLIAAAQLFVSADSASAARFETKNFVITAPTEAFARQVGEAAEYYRHHLAIEWLGEPLPGNWSSKCPIKCNVGQVGAGGATTFTFNNGEVFGWHMTIQGTEERILDSVLPHEVSHMIFASHFRRPLPRWADEGAATLVEHESERLRQTKLLDQVIRTSRRIPLQELLSIKEYPQDMQDVLTLYAEGYSLADFLVRQRGADGKAIYLQFLDDAHRHGWETAFQKHYGTTIAAAEEKWTGWVMAGSPPIAPADSTLIALADQPGAPANPPAGRTRTSETSQETIIRGQSTDEPTPLASVDRARRVVDSSAALDAPTPRSLAAHASSTGGGELPRAYPGEHRMTAQPRQPSIVEASEIPRQPREAWASAADSRTPAGVTPHEESFGHPRPTSFDAPSGIADGRTSSAPIAASDTPRGMRAATGLGPDAWEALPPDGRDDGRTPSHRGFTPGRGGPPASARGLYSP